MTHATTGVDKHSDSLERTPGKMSVKAFLGEGGMRRIRGARVRGILKNWLDSGDQGHTCGWADRLCNEPESRFCHLLAR